MYSKVKKAGIINKRTAVSTNTTGVSRVTNQPRAEKVREASVEDLAKVKGMTRKAAAEIAEFYKQQRVGHG